MDTTGESTNHWARPVRFRYGQYNVDPSPSDPNASIVYRPIIPFHVGGDLGDTVLYGLLDTGADETFLPMTVADALGVILDPTKTATVLSASGQMSVSYGAITLGIERGRHRFDWRTTVGFLNEPFQEALLGHRGFLEYFDVTFWGAKREVMLRRNVMPFPS